jgi:DNA-binding beta-propeller fold protein YncE
MMKKYIFLVLTLLPFIFGCGDKFDANVLSTAKGPVNAGGDTLYIPINPSWGGFNNPQAMIMGQEQFLYVCDTDNNQIVMIDQAGNRLGSLSIKKPIAIAQDHRFNLIVCAQFDTLIGGSTVSYSAVYKIDVLSAAHNLAAAPVKRILPTDISSPHQKDIKYTSVVAFFDNSYYVGRTGPNNTSITSEPDNSILQFVPIDHTRDSAYGRVHDIDPLSSGLISAYGLNCMAPFPKKNLDFVATLSGPESAFKAQWFHHFQTVASEGYQSEFNPKDGIAFVKPNRFVAPTGCCVDAAGNLFVADGDASKDSVYKFSAYGDELQSFGGPAVFGKPVAVAFFDKTLYVLDAKQNKILRFILSTDTQ